MALSMEQKKAVVAELAGVAGDLVKLKPASSKGIYVQKVALSTTMGPGIQVDKTTLDY